MKKQFLLGLMAMLLPLTSWAADDGLKVTVTPKDEAQAIVYAGDKTPEKFEVAVTFGETSLTTDQYSVFYTQGDSGDQITVKDAGEYTAHIIVTASISGLKIGQTAETTFTVTPKPLETITLKETVEKEYGVSFEELGLSAFIENITGLVEYENDDDQTMAKAELEDAYNCLRIWRIDDDEEDAKEKANNEYKVAVRPQKTGEFTSNYIYKEGSEMINTTMTVVPRKLAVTLSEENSKKTFDNEETTLSTLAVKLTSVTPLKDEDAETAFEALLEEDGVTASFTSAKGKTATNTTLLNADAYTLTAELSGTSEVLKNYELADDNKTAEYTIERAELNIELADGKSLTKVYDGKLGLDGTDNVTKLFDIKGVEGDDDVKKLTMTLDAGAKADANEEGYLVHPTVDDQKISSANGNYATQTNLPNYKIVYERENNKFVVNKRPVNYYFAGKTDKYNGNAKTATTGLYEVKDLTGENEGFIEGHKFGTEPTAAFEEGVTVKDVTKEGYTLTEVENSAATVVNGENTEVTKNYEVKYVAEPTLPAETEESDEEEPVFVNVNKYMITKADIKITVFDQTLAFGQIKAGEPVSEDIQKEWLKAGTGIDVTMDDDIVQPGRATDAATIRTMIAFTLSEQAATGKSGEYEEGIISSKKTLEEETDEQKAIENNYDITWGKGTLTIKGIENELVFDGFTGNATEKTADDEDEDAATETIVDVLKKYDGATIEKVTISNLTNYVGIAAKGEAYKPTTKFVEKLWYMLTLPFEVKVRDISKNLGGYAIVNVPDESKTQGNTVYFRLEMQKVPANTLMLFKIDETVESFGDVMFENVTIDAGEIEEGVVANNYGTDVDFVSVYSTTRIDKENEDFMLNNVLYRANSSSINNGTGLDVYPFSGYIRFASGTGANARIFVEDIDGSTTAINAVTGETISNAAEGWYTIDGMKLNAQPTQKGIYINNGKKVVIK